jgi:AhpD family alkylhydroperoxidase
MKVTVFDPAMCCSTGICGPSVDPQLVRFAADLDWLKSRGALVERFNLSQQPAAFAGDAEVKGALEAKGEAGLPLIKMDGVVKSVGGYPSREQLATWAGVDAPAPSIFTDAVSELVAIGAAVASNCEPCFKFHYDKARKLGVSADDMLSAVTIAQNVKDTPAKTVLDTAHRYLKGAVAKAAEEAAEGGCCCGPSSEAGGCCGASEGEVTAEKKSACC